jgi:predicted metal-dependent hydrolase
MRPEATDAIALSHANENLRQEAAAFDLSLTQYRQWMRVRRAMLWAAVVLLPAVMGVAALIIIHHDRFPPETVLMAASALLVDSLGIVGALWRATLRFAAPAVPVPITQLPENEWLRPPAPADDAPAADQPEPAGPGTTGGRGRRPARLPQSRRK